MSEDFSGLYSIRDKRPDDKNFILSTFLKGLYHGESFFSQIPKNIFMDNYKRVANALVENPGIKIKVACLTEDPDVILGYAILSQDNSTVFWVFTKTAWRKRGIAKSLLPSKPTTVAHLTKVGNSLLYKLDNPIFNPFF